MEEGTAMGKTDEANRRLVVGIVAALAIVGLFAWGLLNRLETGKVRVELADAKKQLSAMVTQAELDSALARAAELDERIAKLETPEAEVEEPSMEPSLPAEGGQAFLDMFAALGAGEGEGGEEGQNPLAQMFSGEGGKKLADYAARMSMDMAFGDFFNELTLPEDTEGKVRDILAAHMSEQIAKGMEALQSGFDEEKIEQMEQDAEEQLREELSAVLTPQEMDVFDEYSETMGERMLAQNYDMQLNLYAPGMTPEDRALVRDVLVDETLAIGEQMGQDMGMGMNTDIQGAFNMQLQAFESARERLLEELDEEQLAFFDRFVEAQEQAFEMAAALFGNMAGQQEESEQQ
jgi:hypothetical protein